MEKAEKEMKSSPENYRERIEKIRSRIKEREEITSAIRFLESNGYTIEKTDELESTTKLFESNDSLVETSQENEEYFGE